MSKEILHKLSVLNPEAVALDGYVEHIESIALHSGRYLLIYNTEKIIGNLISDGMTQEEAQEYFSYNIAGLYGPNMPIFI